MRKWIYYCGSWGSCAELEEDWLPRKERQPQKKQAASRRKAG